MRVVSWNVNGIRALLRRTTLEDLLQSLEADVLCLQETKLSECSNISDVKMAFPLGYTSFWSICRARKGYSGVATFVRHPPLRVWEGVGAPALDGEGRCVVVDLGSLVVFNVYVPNGGRGTHRVDFKMEYLSALEQRMREQVELGKNVCLVGDINIAHKEQDIFDPKRFADCTGFLPKERRWLDNLVGDTSLPHEDASSWKGGFVDSLRHFEPSTPRLYSYWDVKTDKRPVNLGWRIDYCIISSSLVQHLKGAVIHKDVFGSDHCPVSVDLDLPWELQPVDLCAGGIPCGDVLDPGCDSRSFPHFATMLGKTKNKQRSLVGFLAQASSPGVMTSSSPSSSSGNGACSSSPFDRVEEVSRAAGASRGNREQPTKVPPLQEGQASLRSFFSPSASQKRSMGEHHASGGGDAEGPPQKQSNVNE